MGTRKVSHAWGTSDFWPRKAEAGRKLPKSGKTIGISLQNVMFSKNKLQQNRAWGPPFVCPSTFA